MAIASVSAKAKPSLFAPAAVAYSSPLVAAAPLPYVAASSSQVVSRNYHGIAAPLIASAPLVATAPAVAYSGALVSPYAALPRFASPYSGLPTAYSGQILL